MSYVAYGGSLVNVTVGRYCSIGQWAEIGLFRHPSRGFVATHPAFFSSNNQAVSDCYVDRSKFDEFPSPTTLGSDVWIGNRAIIPGGVTIGHGAIVAAGAIVTRAVPPYAIVGGNPAQIIRYRFSDDDIAFLLNHPWWELSPEQIHSLAGDFDDITRLGPRLEKIFSSPV